MDEDIEKAKTVAKFEWQLLQMNPVERAKMAFRAGVAIYNHYNAVFHSEEGVAQLFYKGGYGVGAVTGVATDFIVTDAVAQELTQIGGEIGGKPTGLQNVAEVRVEDTSIKEYSYFTNGMSSEDAARYIANSEAKFYGEFAVRARAAGLSDAQIGEAFEAMRVGDYTKMASYFDTSSSVDSAVFWSGNKDGAAAYANDIGGTIMEQTPGGQVFDNWRGLDGMYPEWNTGSALDQKPIWEALSSQYARGAAGSVTYAHLSGYVGDVWRETELPIINEKIEEGIVTEILEVYTNGK